MLKFTEFVDKKQRDARKQLKIVEKLLKNQELEVKDNLGKDDPFLFVYNPEKNTFFEGIRLYKIGEDLAFRVQKEEKTEPFGRAYALNIEEMFEDFTTDYSPEESGKRIIKTVGNEVKRFFEKSAEAEKDIKDKQEFDTNPYNKVVVRSYDFGSDYSSLVYMKP